MNEIKFKMSSSPARPSSRLRNEVSMGNGQYKKILELMLDLEKKVDNKFIEQKQQTSQAIMTAYNVDEFRKEMEIMLDDSLNNMELKFQSNYDNRLNQVEEELDKQIKIAVELQKVTEYYDVRFQENE